MPHPNALNYRLRQLQGISSTHKKAATILDTAPVIYQNLRLNLAADLHSAVGDHYDGFNEICAAAFSRLALSIRPGPSGAMGFANWFLTLPGSEPTKQVRMVSKVRRKLDVCDQ
jgi:hypothetical protein